MCLPSNVTDEIFIILKAEGVLIRIHSYMQEDIILKEILIEAML
jgi:hypothetical protein